MAIRGSVARAPRKAFYGDLVKGGFDEGIKPLTDVIDKKEKPEDEKVENQDGSTTSGTNGTSTSDTNGGASIGIKPDGTWPTGEKYAKAKWNLDLNDLSRQRDELTPNSDDYKRIQNMINEAMGDSTRH